MQPDPRLEDRAEEARRREGEALVRLADAAMSGRAPSDFAIQWSNDFFKAQTGTFVPFTVTIDPSKITATSALMYLRAVRRGAPPSSTVRGGRSATRSTSFSGRLEGQAGTLSDHAGLPSAG